MSHSFTSTAKSRDSAPRHCTRNDLPISVLRILEDARRSRKGDYLVYSNLMKRLSGISLTEAQYAAVHRKLIDMLEV